MDNYDVKRLALVYACQAEIEGMKAENRALKYYGDPIKWGNDDFQAKADEMKNIAYANNDQL